MKKLAIICVCIAALGFAAIAYTQLDMTNSVLIHLDLELDKSLLGEEEVQVRMSAMDRHINVHFDSPVAGPDEPVLIWQQDIPLIVDEGMPLQVMFELKRAGGYRLPLDYRVDAQYSVNGSTYRELTTNTLQVPGGYTGEASLSISGTVVKR